MDSRFKLLYERLDMIQVSHISGLKWHLFKVLYTLKKVYIFSENKSILEKACLVICLYLKKKQASSSFTENHEICKVATISDDVIDPSDTLCNPIETTYLLNTAPVNSERKISVTSNMF